MPKPSVEDKAPKQLDVDKLIDNAYTILNGELPDSNENCEYCKWLEKTSKIR